MIEERVKGDLKGISGSCRKKCRKTKLSQKKQRKISRNPLPKGEKLISLTYRKIVLGGTAGRRTKWCGGLYFLIR
jgi:hypothetical protein